MALELALLGGLVLLGLGDDGVHRDGGLAGGAVTDDQFALAATDRDHGVDGHDAGLHGNGHGLTGNDARSQLLNGILGFTLDVAFAVDRLTESIDHAAKEALADGNGKEAAGGLHFVAGLDAFSVAENNATDFGFFEVESQAERAVGELNHFVEHDVAQTFNLGCAVTDLAHDAHV